MDKLANDSAIIAALSNELSIDLDLDRVEYDVDKVVILNLSDLELVQIPTNVWHLTNLKVLDLNDNLLDSVPDEIGQLVNLEELWLWNNHLRNVPRSIVGLPNLVGLYLRGNAISGLSEEIVSLTKLEWLNLSRNILKDIPVELFELQSLQWLSLEENYLTELPSTISKNKELLILNISCNRIVEVPVQLENLTKLNYLNLSGNNIIHIPSAIANLKELRYLDLGYNNLRQLPFEIGKLNNLNRVYVAPEMFDELEYVTKNILRYEDLVSGSDRMSWLKEHRIVNRIVFSPFMTGLSLAGNPRLISPPPEIVAQGTKQVLNFLTELQDNSMIRNEAKLLVVGEGGTGKSSLLRSLRDEQFDATLSTTHGVEVSTYKLLHPQQEQTLITLNTWDFGGQHIYHATHQFFLTKRSLYIVVWNARLGAEQGRLHYWLDTIKALAPDSPVLIVATHTDERTPDINYQLYKDAYPQLVGSFFISNKTGAGVSALKSALTDQAGHLPLIGQPWPYKWITAEQALLQRTEHHIDAGEYIRICAESNVDEDTATGILGRYLHDLGRILYFVDDDILGNMIVLQPNWVTKAISRVLTDEKVAANRGVLEHLELSRIWLQDENGRRYERYLYPSFLRLMERFDLTYQLAEPGEQAIASLIPQLLPHEPPLNLPNWPEKPATGQSLVEMVYRLDFVPAGIMSWFIVRTHRYTSHIHWREGVVLAYEGHEARVELNPMLRELRLVVWGSFPENFFTILMKTIDEILKRFDGLQPERRVPCICHRMRNVQKRCQRFYLYEDLIRRREKGKDFVDCPDTFEDVSVLELLYGIHISTDRQVMRDIKDGQKQIRTVMEDQVALILERVQQQSELITRNFTRQWNLEMKKIEAECPNTFYLMPGSQNIFNPQNWISQEYKLYLVCQHPPSPHGVGDGYSMRQPEQWWTSVSPWFNYLIEFLRVVVPVAGKIAGVVNDKAKMDEMKSSIELMEEIMKNLPTIAMMDSMERSGVGANTAENQLVVGPALRALYSFLKEGDPVQRWGDLNKIVTPDANILWLCSEHSQAYEVKPLVLPAEL